MYSLEDLCGKWGLSLGLIDKITGRNLEKVGRGYRLLRPFNFDGFYFTSHGVYEEDELRNPEDSCTG